MHCGTISNVSGRNGKKEICLPHKEYLTNQICERTNMAIKCKISVTVAYRCIGISKKQVCLQNKEYVTGHRCEYTNVASKYL